jgi:hypothetical protein
MLGKYINNTIKIFLASMIFYFAFWVIFIAIKFNEILEIPRSHPLAQKCGYSWINYSDQLFDFSTMIFAMSLMEGFIFKYFFYLSMQFAAFMIILECTWTFLSGQRFPLYIRNSSLISSVLLVIYKIYFELLHNMLNASVSGAGKFNERY